MTSLVRGLTESDALAYRDIRLRALTLAPSAFTSDPSAYQNFTEEDYRRRCSFTKNSFIFGAFQADTLVGIAGGYVDPLPKRSHIGYVVGVWVDEEIRNQGHARALVSAVIEQHKQNSALKSLQLSVTSDNLQAVGLYKSLGFISWGEEPSALITNNISYNEIHMHRELS